MPPGKAKNVEKARKASASPWFPSWGTPKFGLTLAPIGGYQAESETVGGTTVDTATTELGLHTGLNNVPVVPGNPGLEVSVGALGAFGSTVDTTPGAGDGITTYHREVGTIGLVYYYHFLREEIDFSRGKIGPSDGTQLVQTAHGKWDNGLLILSWLSGHYTFDYIRAFYSSFDQDFLIQTDHWLHARLQLELLSFYVDFGPGVTYATEYDPTPIGGGAETASGKSDYWKVASGLHLFWKLGASGVAKYVVDSSESGLASLANVRLPEQELAQPSPIAQPADSVQATFFAGANNIYAGFGLGYQYNLQILNLGEHGGAPRQTTKESGITASYSTAI